MRYSLNAVTCPSCDSQKIERIHRSRLEKLMLRNPKFLCHSCNKKFFEKISPGILFSGRLDLGREIQTRSHFTQR
jgi:ribosomal protein L37AE/L43A